MAVYTVHAGHAKQGNAYGGASGKCHESVEDRLIKDAVIKYLKMAGHIVYDCTVDSGSSQSGIIAEIKNKINSYDNVTANISIHLNCYNGNANGTECEVYQNIGQTSEIANRICSKIASLGFLNRGVKTRTDLGVLKGIVNGGSNILIETFFCDSSADYFLYQNIGPDVMGKTITEAIINAKIEIPTKTQQIINNDQKTEGGITTMQCFYTVDGKGPVHYFDGFQIHPLAHPDEMSILNKIYKDNNGRDIPCYSFSSNAPWHARLEAAINRTKNEEEQK